MQTWSTSLQENTQRTTQGNSISIYQDTFTIKNAIEQTNRLKKAYPQLPKGFYELLLDRIEANSFTDKRLKDAIDHLIDTFTYPVPQIANIIGFDKRVKLYAYSSLTDEVSNGRKWNEFAKVKVNGKNFWITATDKVMFNIGDEL